jgi:type I restriction enzyme R subunit
MDEAEWQTRRERIDKRLRKCNPQWKIVPWTAGLDTSKLTCHAVTEFPTDNGPADYALFVSGNLLGILEAKRVSVSPQNVLEQAKRYAAGAAGPGNWKGLKVPFLYATNGEIIWHLDTRAEKLVSRTVANFHTSAAMAERYGFDADTSRRWLLDTPPEKIPGLRPYQVAAIVATEQAMLAGQRELLIAMATGTGKTFLTVAQIYRLLESKQFRRILFLVDRKALAAQAVRTFNAFDTPQGNKLTQEYEVYSQRFQREDFGDDEPFDPKVLPNEYLTDPKPSHTFVYVSTIQRMARNLFGAEAAFPQSPSDPDIEVDADKLDIPIHAFDLVIADECHRGYTLQESSLWRDTISHFDCLKIGLTATPAPHTTALFGAPVFRYDVEQAILEGHLVDYEAVSIKSEVRMNGAFLKEGEEVGLIDPVTGNERRDELEDERSFPSEEIEKRITAPQSNRKIIEEIAQYAYAHEKETGHFPKILIFAVNDVQHMSHADQLVRVCREVFNQGDDFVQKITGNANVDRPLQRIREFRNRPKPAVVVTVDMLSTGVDIPALEFIVFLRPVKSRILWVQMLGRGTRKCPGINKTKFTVFDCFDGTLIQYFKNTTDFEIQPPTKTPLTIPQIIENIWQNVDRGYHVRILVKRLRRTEKDMSGEARVEFARWIPDGDVGAFAGKLPELVKKDFTVTMKLLRNEEFQRLLQEYKRAYAPFFVGYEVEDKVSSKKVERFGKYDTAESYLDAFSRYVKENAEKVDALSILLKRPRDWRPKALEDLRIALAHNQFDERKLQDAHRVASHKALADVISIVKHAAKAQEPVLTAEERVNRAMEKLVAKSKFTAEQMQWLSLIREQLVKNLVIEEDDFDNTPLLQGRGGAAKATKVFGALRALVDELNEAVAGS